MQSQMQLPQLNVALLLWHKQSMLLQVLVTGKISQAVVVAAAAYRKEAAFREVTGIKRTKLIIDDFHTMTHVSHFTSVRA